MFLVKQLPIVKKILAVNWNDKRKIILYILKCFDEKIKSTDFTRWVIIIKTLFERVLKKSL